MPRDCLDEPRLVVWPKALLIESGIHHSCIYPYLIVGPLGLASRCRPLTGYASLKISLLLLILNGQYSACKKSIENIDNEEH